MSLLQLMPLKRKRINLNKKLHLLFQEAEEMVVSQKIPISILKQTIIILNQIFRVDEEKGLTNLIETTSLISVVIVLTVILERREMNNLTVKDSHQRVIMAITLEEVLVEENLVEISDNLRVKVIGEEEEEEEEGLEIETKMGIISEEVSVGVGDEDSQEITSMIGVMILRVEIVGWAEDHLGIIKKIEIKIQIFKEIIPTMGFDLKMEVAKINFINSRLQNNNHNLLKTFSPKFMSNPPKFSTLIRFLLFNPSLKLI